jgi:hypothetical protein
VEEHSLLLLLVLEREIKDSCPPDFFFVGCLFVGFGAKKKIQGRRLQKNTNMKPLKVAKTKPKNLVRTPLCFVFYFSFSGVVNQLNLEIQKNEPKISTSGNDESLMKLKRIQKNMDKSKAAPAPTKKTSAPQQPSRQQLKENAIPNRNVKKMEFKAAKKAVPTTSALPQKPRNPQLRKSAQIKPPPLQPKPNVNNTPTPPPLPSSLDSSPRLAAVSKKSTPFVEKIKRGVALRNIPNSKLSPTKHKRISNENNYHLAEILARKIQERRVAIKEDEDVHNLTSNSDWNWN